MACHYVDLPGSPAWPLPRRDDSGLQRRPDLDDERHWAWEMAGMFPGRERLIVWVCKGEAGVAIKPEGEKPWHA
jgi:hypothetical protein